MGQEWSLLSTIEGLLGVEGEGMADWGGDEGSWALAEEPLSKLTL